MATIFENLKSFVTPELISKAASFLGESPSQVSSAMSSVLPAFLGRFLAKGDSAPVKNLLESAHKTNLLKNVDHLFEGKASSEVMKIGDKLKDLLLGDKETALNSYIASKDVISNQNSKKLTSLVAMLMAGFLGKRLAGHNGNMNALLGEVNEDRSALMGLLPADLRGSLGITDSMKHYGTASSNVSTPKVTVTPPRKKKRGMGWLLWLLHLVLLALLLWWWRSCSHRKADKVVEEVHQVAQEIKVPVVKQIEGERIPTELSLPNGVKLHAFKGGIEDRMMAFLASDEFRNATEADLKDRWFEFDNIDFEFDSTTDLMQGSQAQIDNLIAILKYYSDANVVVGGHADAKGREGVNLAISRERANTIKGLFERGGINGTRVSTFGFGESQAHVSAAASDAERAKDRDIALRFRK